MAVGLPPFPRHFLWVEMGIRAKTGVNVIWIHSPLKNMIYPVFGCIISYPYQVVYMVISDIYRILHVIYLNVTVYIGHITWYITDIVPATSYVIWSRGTTTTIKEYCSYHAGVHTVTSMSYNGATSSVRPHVQWFDESCTDWNLWHTWTVAIPPHPHVNSPPQQQTRCPFLQQDTVGSRRQER